ncbi:hypothetical protein [Phaffia rhodozyma]|uniref:Mediator of RNA polymerase II transcription subunit 18 n=1 Tax=Phaffia rhodozyma TaxID=264483 RepID=A0A0F7SMM7_PHARH|nr:hypothetical protein [Phaffia rhodozyma]
MVPTSVHPSQRFEVSLLGHLASSIHPLLIEKLSRMSILSSPFIQEESLMQPLARQIGSRAEDGTIRARKVDEDGELMTYLVAYQRPESIRATPQALVTPCTYTQISAGCSGEEAATQLGFQKVSSSTKRGFIFMLAVGLRIEVYSLDTNDVRSPSTPETYTIKVLSPPIPYALVAQTIEHALNIRRQLVGLVKLGRVEGSN